MASNNKLNYAKHNLTDEAVKDHLSWLNPDDEEYQYEEIDFSQNNMNSAGLKHVLEICRKCPRLRVLKLYKNKIDDAGAEGLAELCSVVPTIREIHLSHNRFTAEGCSYIVSEVEKTRSPQGLPLWLRLEQNDIEDPDTLANEMRSSASVCVADDARCNARHCVQGKKIHLPFFRLQRGMGGSRNGEAATIRGSRHDARVSGAHDVKGSSGDGWSKGGWGQNEWDEWEEDGWWGYDETWDEPERWQGVGRDARERDSRNGGGGASSTGGSGGHGYYQPPERPEWFSHYAEEQNKRLDLIFSILADLQKDKDRMDQGMQQIRRELDGYAMGHQQIGQAMGSQMSPMGQQMGHQQMGQQMNQQMGAQMGPQMGQTQQMVHQANGGPVIQPIIMQPVDVQQQQQQQGQQQYYWPG